MFRKIIVISFFLFLFQGKGFLYAQEQFMQYTSEKYKYSVMLPEEWKRSDQVRNPNIGMVLISESGATISISFYELNTIKLEEFVEQYFGSMTEDGLNVELEEKGMLSTKAGQVEYMVIGSDQGESAKKEKVCFYARVNEVAVVSAKQKASEFYQLMPVFNRVFQSFTFETSQEEVEEGPLKIH